jgi:FixJ family two-component response regulator
MMVRSRPLRSSSAAFHLAFPAMSMNPASADRPLVVIVDDDEDVRLALQELLHSVDLETAGFATTQNLLQADLPERPGCLILDVRMPGASGLDLQQHLVRSGNSRPIIFLSGHGDIAMTVQAMKAGAVDFLTKPVRDQALLDAVTAAIEKDIAQSATARRARQASERYASLTPRERQVLHEVVKGRLNKQIAFDLGLSEITIKLHRSNGARKMQARSVTELIRIWETLPVELRDDSTV